MPSRVMKIKYNGQYTLTDKERVVFNIVAHYPNGRTVFEIDEKDLKKQSAKMVHGTVFGALKKMHKLEYVSREKEKKGRKRVTYRITPKGLRFFLRTFDYVKDAKSEYRELKSIFKMHQSFSNQLFLDFCDEDIRIAMEVAIAWGFSDDDEEISTEYIIRKLAIFFLGDVSEVSYNLAHTESVKSVLRYEEWKNIKTEGENIVRVVLKKHRELVNPAVDNILVSLKQNYDCLTMAYNKIRRESA